MGAADLRYNTLRERQTMIDLTESQTSVLKQGHPVRVSMPALGGDLILLLADTKESTGSVLKEACQDLQEQEGWQALVNQGRAAWTRENPD
jgi:hypothetical protein